MSEYAGFAFILLSKSTCLPKNPENHLNVGLKKTQNIDYMGEGDVSHYGFLLCQPLQAFKVGDKLTVQVIGDRGHGCKETEERDEARSEREAIYHL